VSEFKDEWSEATLSEMLDAAAVRRKKLQFRSWHRGTRELDLILGPFADAMLETLDAAELEDYERLLNLQDSDLMDWVLGARPVPAEVDSPLLQRIVAFRQPR
jgi:antitoxin CptB